MELCQSCIDTGFSSVMIDGSRLSLEENIEATRQVAELAHAVVTDRALRREIIESQQRRMAALATRSVDQELKLLLDLE